MFGFKKKKKTPLGGDGASDLTAPSLVERKSSRASILSFGKKSHKSKKVANPTRFYTTDGVQPIETTPKIDNIIKSNYQDLLPNKGRSYNIEHAPGLQALGQLASDLEALQLRRQSGDRGSGAQESCPDVSTDGEGGTREGEKRDLGLIPAEAWGEQEVLSWLRENNLEYFVDLFDGCGIDGDYLLQITEEDLVELEVDDTALRKRFLSAVNGLLNTNEDEIDITLPKSGDDNSGSEWESLEEIDDDQGEATTSSDAIAANDVSASDHDLVRPPTGFSQGQHSRIGKALDDWTQGDVILWLDTIGLGKYADNFRSHRITGSKLRNIDMSLLDQMSITRAEDREKLLSSLYDLTQSSADNAQLLTSIGDASDYDRQKYLAAVTVMQSHSPRVQVIPAEPLGSPDRSGSSCSNGSESDGHEGKKKKKKKKGSITKLRDAISGMSKSSPALVRVWTDVGKAKDKPVRLKLELDENASAKRLVNLCLESMSMIEDPRLYCIAEVCVADDKDHSTVTDRELEDNERPLKVQRSWKESPSGHFELRQRTAQGGVIKLVLKMPGEQPKGKLVALSLSTPTKELIPLALLKYDMLDAAPMDFCLLEVEKNGDLQPVDDETLLLQQESHAYVLCMRDSLEELTNNNEQHEVEGAKDGNQLPDTRPRRGSGDNESRSKDPTPGGKSRISGADITRRGSGDSRGAEGEDGAGMTDIIRQGSGEGVGAKGPTPRGKDRANRSDVARQGSWDGSRSVDDYSRANSRADQKREIADSRNSLNSSQSSLAMKGDGEKLTQLEQEMASIEQSLQPKVSRSVSWSANVHNREETKALMTSRSMDGASPGDRLVCLEEENRALREKQREFEKFEEIFGKLKSTLTRLNTDTNMKLLERRRASNPDLDSLPRELAAPMFQLEGLSQEVEAKQARVNELREQSGKSDDNNNSHLRLEEASLISLKLEQTRLLCVVEVAVADYQLSCVKRKELTESRSLITILPPNKLFTIVSTTVNAGEDGYQFELDSITGRKGIFIGKCEDGGTMRAGDRVIEINNHSTFTSSVAEGNTKLNSTSKVKLVLLRDATSLDDPPVSGLGAKLASTNSALVDANTRNEALAAEVEKLKSELVAAKAGKQSPDLSSPNHKTIGHRDLAAILENLDDDIPLWEAIKSHKKSEILQVFQEEVQEANRQKQYLDQLYTLMLERAPNLLEELEQDFGATSEISGDEEFC